ncbi:cytochrome c [Geobacter sp. AOG2]|uniref:cytochrome c n=1 Tax=Geobacter sp. AOG2 TaxID=1566347 RepID=UPI001CC4D782|nr:cytochrome c [Geobacter sp. AOG2]
MTLLRNIVLSLLISLLAGGTSYAAENVPPEKIRLGEAMYLEGILPSKEPMEAIVKGDIVVYGTVFSCTSCHMRSGLGSYEGQVITPPTNGTTLFRPYYGGPSLSDAELAKIPKLYRQPIRRPAYTDATLARALGSGIDPSGRELNSVMPRYLLNDADMALLIAYLKQLSATYSPGVSDTTIRFATVITDAVTSANRDALVKPLESYITMHNNQASSYVSRARTGGIGAEIMDLAYRKITLDVWELKGPSETWRAQLDKLYHDKPVFALLGGITDNEWLPIHRFCEDNRVPCIFPITDLPVISDNDWYTLYFSKGLYQEGEAAARFLSGRKPSTETLNVVQVVAPSRRSAELARGFEETWAELGRPSSTVQTLRSNEAITVGYLEELHKKYPMAIVLLWTDKLSLQTSEMVGTDADFQEFFISSGLLGEKFRDLPAKLRPTTYITYPYRLPQDEMVYKNLAVIWLNSRRITADNQRIATRTFSLISLVVESLMHMKRNFYRDYFLDVISMLRDVSTSPDYVRLSFGPGQHYTSKGCYIVQLSQDSKPQLIAKSDWVIH